MKLDIRTSTNELFINSDYGSLRSIIKNVISNAIKFSYTQGTITLLYSQTETNTIIRVRDNGIGISKNTIESIQFRDTIEPTEGPLGDIGLGVGLNNSSTLLQTIGGRIQIKNNKPKGTIVDIILDHNLSNELV